MSTPTRCYVCGATETGHDVGDHCDPLLERALIARLLDRGRLERVIAARYGDDDRPYRPY